MGTCKACLYWAITRKIKNNIADCDMVDSVIKDPLKTFEIEVSADDDSNLRTVLMTGENFGCVHFKQKKQ